MQQHIINTPLQYSLANYMNDGIVQKLNNYEGKLTNLITSLGYNKISSTNLCPFNVSLTC